MPRIRLLRLGSCHGGRCRGRGSGPARADGLPFQAGEACPARTVSPPAPRLGTCLRATPGWGCGGRPGRAPAGAPRAGLRGCPGWGLGAAPRVGLRPVLRPARPSCPGGRPRRLARAAGFLPFPGGGIEGAGKVSRPPSRLRLPAAWSCPSPQRGGRSRPLIGYEQQCISRPRADDPMFIGGYPDRGWWRAGRGAGGRPAGGPERSVPCSVTWPL